MPRKKRNGSGKSLFYSPKPLDNRKFGRGRLAAILDLRHPNQGIKTRFKIGELFVGKTAVMAPHCDDASLNYGGGIIKFTQAGGKVHIVNVSPGHRAPFKGIEQSNSEAKIAKRVAEGKKEAEILKAKFHYLDLRKLYLERKVVPEEAKKFYQALDKINPTTLVVPGPFETHPDHRNVRVMSLNWAAAKAWKGKPMVIVEAPSMWGSVPESHLTHLLQMDASTYRKRMRAQAAHVSQWKRTDFPRVSDLKARASAIVGGELVHGLVEKTPKLEPTEAYSQHLVVRKGNRLVFQRLSEKTRRQLAERK